jgi:hypothetical protein
MKVKMRVKKNANQIKCGVYWNSAMDIYLGRVIEFNFRASWWDKTRYEAKGWVWGEAWLEKPYEYSNETDP